MATTYKTLLASDIQPVRSKLHEAIPITGTIISGTYANRNIKNYAHGMFQSVYDYPYLSSSANHIFDLTFGFASSSPLSGAATTQNAQKIQIYNEMAQVLAGHDATGSILQFPNIDPALGTGRPAQFPKFKECIFVNFARLLAKDEVQKGSFSMTLGVDCSGSTGGTSVVRRLVIADTSGSNNYRTDSPAGEYGALYATGSTDYALYGDNGNAGGAICGLVYYQAGIAVLSSSVFQVQASGGILNNASVADQVLPGGTFLNDSGGYVVMQSASLNPASQRADIAGLMVTSSISSSANAVRDRIANISFNNTTELNSTVYFCRANANEFNYSSNPTYLKQSKIRVKETRTDEPITYPTTVGLYSQDNALLAVAKLSEPLKKQPANEFTLRVRLDY